MDGLRRRRTSRPASARTTGRADDADGHGRDPGRRPVHHDARRPRRTCSRPAGLLDAPMPTHYEPLESPVPQRALPGASARTRSAITWERPENPLVEPDDDRYPHVASTFRLTEHHTAGPMSRNLPWLAELQPEMFAEIDPVLAARGRASRTAEWMVIETPRAEIEARAKVTNRVQPLRIGGATLHQVCLPWHFGTLQDQRAGRDGRLRQRPGGDLRRPERDHPRVQGVPLQRARGAARGRDDGAARRRRRARATRRPSSDHASADSASRDASATAAGEPGDLDAMEVAIQRARRPARWASSPTRRCASAARRARWRASSGTTCPPTSYAAGARPTTTRARCRPRRGGTCASWRRSRSPTRPSRR